MNQKRPHGFKVHFGAPLISHLSFVGDSIIFARANGEEAKHLAEILKTYEAFSGQRINLEKSELSCIQNVPSTKIDELDKLLRVKAMERHVNYLGLPTILGRSKTQVFNFARDRVWKKLKGWKEKTFSKAG